MEMPSLAFVVIDPQVADPNYPLIPVRDHLRDMEVVDADEDVIVLGICTVPAPPDVATVNLMAPIGVGLESRRGAQVILHEGGYSSRHEFLAPADAKAG